MSAYSINSEVARVLDLVEDALKNNVDDLTLINRLRACTGEPPLVELDFEAFDLFMKDPDAGMLILY